MASFFVVAVANLNMRCYDDRTQTIRTYQMEQIEALYKTVVGFLNGALVLVCLLISITVAVLWFKSGGLSVTGTMVQSTVNAVVGNYQLLDVYTINSYDEYLSTGNRRGYECYGISTSQCKSYIQTIRHPESRACMIEALDGATGPNPIAAIFSQPIFDDSSIFFLMVICGFTSIVFSAFGVFALRPDATDNTKVTLITNFVVFMIFVMMLASLRYEHHSLTEREEYQVGKTQCMHIVNYTKQ